MSELIKQPIVIFPQGELFIEDGAEMPIVIRYYEDNICLEQDGMYIIINPKYMQKLFREIQKHLPEAKELYKLK